MSTKDRPPLGLALEPGEYQCFVAVPDLHGGAVRISGRLHLRADEPPFAEVFGDVPTPAKEALPGVGFPDRVRHPVIVVDLVRGDTVLLLDCTIDVWFDQRAFLHAAAAIVRGHEQATDTYVCVGARVQITGSDAVIAPTPLASAQLPMKAQPDDEAYVWSVTERLPRSIASSDFGATVSGERAWSYSPPLGWSHRVSFSPVIDVALATPVDLTTLIDEWIEPLKRIVSLATDRSERVTLLEVRGVDEPPRPSSSDADPVPTARQVYGAHIAQDPFASDDNAVRNLHLAFNTWQDGSTSLVELCRGWQAAVAAKHPLIETLGTLLFLPPLHPRPRLLLFIQALEGLHGFNEKATDEARQAKHTAARAEALADIESVEGIDPKTAKFAKKHLAKWPPSSLDVALRAVVKTLPVDLTEALHQLTIVQAVITTDQPVSEWSNALRVVRNGLSHGDRGWPREDLEPAADLLEVVCRAHLMQLIGCREGDVGAWLTRRMS